jgi:cystathionine beta-lyase/cystathionine gamma-synthase
VFQHPLDLGADLSVYSATKYLAGQSDILAGVIMSPDSTLIASLRGMRAILGNILQPDECWILDSRLPTVELRMSRQSKNAARIVPQLAEHPKVRAAYYPALITDPEQARIRDKQCRFPGAVFALDLHGGRSAAFDFLRRLRIAKNAVSLGGVETLACHPRTTTHSEMSTDELTRYGIGEGLVRVSIGVEDHRDLLRDFLDALA